ncbi:MAG: hypothetical protein ACYC75_02375 [Minisyncoccota bacterium]
MSKTETVEERQGKEKALLLANLKKVPIVHIACEKSSISRATYYRWRTEDNEFAKNADDALTEGEALITDMSESQLISLIKERKFPAVHLWLRHHHPKYKDKIEVVTRPVEDDTLTSEQEATVKKALKLAKLSRPKTSAYGKQK